MLLGTAEPHYEGMSTTSVGDWTRYYKELELAGRMVHKRKYLSMKRQRVPADCLGSSMV